MENCPEIEEIDDFICIDKIESAEEVITWGTHGSSGLTDQNVEEKKEEPKAEEEKVEENLNLNLEKLNLNPNPDFPTHNGFSKPLNLENLINKEKSDLLRRLREKESENLFQKMRIDALEAELTAKKSFRGYENYGLFNANCGYTTITNSGVATNGVANCIYPGGYYTYNY
jgi:hypothetical protein